MEVIVEIMFTEMIGRTGAALGLGEGVEVGAGMARFSTLSTSTKDAWHTSHQDPLTLALVASMVSRYNIT